MADQEIVLDAEEQALQREARLAGYRQAIAEGTAATVPDLSVEVPERFLDVGDGVSQFPGLVAQDAADDLADGVAQQIVNDTRGLSRTLLIVGDIDVTAACALARRMPEECTALTRRLDTARAALATAPSVPSPPTFAAPIDKDKDKDKAEHEIVDGIGVSLMALGAPAVAGVLQGLGAAAKALPAVLELMKTDVTVRPSPVEVSDEVVIAAVARSLRQRQVVVRIASCTTTPDNEVTQALKALAEARDSLADALAMFTVAHLEGGAGALVERQQAVLSGLVTAHDKLLDSGKPTDQLRERIDALQEWLTTNSPLVDRARAAAAAATVLVEQATTYLTASHEPGATGLTPATIAALFDEVLAKESKVDILRLTCTRAVGETVWKERWRGDQALHAGGLGAQWTLIKADGLVTSAGEFTAARSVTLRLGEPLVWG